MGLIKILIISPFLYNRVQYLFRLILRGEIIEIHKFYKPNQIELYFKQNGI